MAKFKNPITGQIIEVTEDHANQVIRPQKFFIEFNMGFEESSSVSESTQAVGKRKRKKGSSDE